MLAKLGVRFCRYRRLIEAGFLPVPSRGIHTKRQLHVLLATAVERTHRAGLEDAGPELPVPPVADVPEIQAIRTPKSVMAEGVMQANCVGKLLPSIAEGKLFLYRVFYPERATLSIRWYSGSWQIDDLEAEANRPVSDDTRSFVQKWLKTKVTMKES